MHDLSEGIEVPAVNSDLVQVLRPIHCRLDTDRFAEELYRKAQAAGAGTQSATGGAEPHGSPQPDAGAGPTKSGKSSSDDDVIDADFRMVDDDK